jgi:alpha-1,2-mannosyltransferase
MQASPRTSLALPARRSPLLGELWIYAGLCLFFAVIFVQYSAKIHAADRANLSAYLRWTPLVRQLPEVNIWRTTNWPNSPMMAMILKPFMDVEPALLGSQYWLLAKMAMTLVSVWLVFRMLDRPETPFPLWGKALAVLLTLRPIEGDLVHGNVNLFILLTVVSCLYAYRRGWDVAAGLCLALGIACKITPVLFLPYFVWKRSWTALGASLAGMVLYLVLLPGLYYGWQQNLENLGAWYDGMIQPFVVKNEVTSEHPNQSLPGLLERTLRHRPSSTIWDEDKLEFEPTEYHNFVDLPRPVVSGIVKGALLLFTLGTVLWMRRSKLDRSDWRWSAEFAVIILGMLLFSERTWKHHAVTLLVPFAVLCHQVSGFRLTRAHRRISFAVLGSVAVLMLMTSSNSAKEGVHGSFGRLALVYGAYTWSFLILMAAMFWISGKRCPEPARSANPVAEDDWSVRLDSVKNEPRKRGGGGNGRTEEVAGAGPHIEAVARRPG